ncbi:urease accessory protein UreD [Marine Group I thaumarchaeote]|jgi:urease accessory protein|uniref:Urease accessory protein UreD n=3 Tax=Nitrososphaerota TaxID=651137 RepID=A0A7K4NNE0_9ARCH|nr:putative UreD urease accessory protein [uncultured marine crenarchaeote HF4000_APKG8D22]NWK02132.1 urease accessory protein UreD [Marine Group I thaumarchaeote]
MTDLKFCFPEDVPSQFASFDGKISQMDVGKTGKIGFLKLTLGFDSQRNKTIITEQRSCVPLYVQRALYYDESIPSMAHVFVLSPSGGVLQGDRYRTDIELKNGAMSHITTQGATRIYKMNSNYATQMINLNVGKDCYLEFLPEQLIPYKNSRYYQKATFKVDDSATLVYSETIVPGRVAMGELFDYDVCCLKTLCYDDKQEMKFHDNCILEPKKQTMNSLGIFGNRTVLSMMYVVTKKECVEELYEIINQIFKDNDEIIGGASILPNNSGLSVRILSNSSEVNKITVYNIAQIIRKQIIHNVKH